MIRSNFFIQRSPFQIASPLLCYPSNLKQALPQGPRTPILRNGGYFASGRCCPQLAQASACALLIDKSTAQFITYKGTSRCLRQSVNCYHTCKSYLLNADCWSVRQRKAKIDLVFLWRKETVDYFVPRVETPGTKTHCYV